ncbi:GAF domain-containing protein [Streptomyces sp. NPDC097704]|uniref:GAF domain-containing protein n=1 Tax=Streptomyces sp. NPDC097704 TaxID=3157101 RepID=UPI0033208EED
MNREQAITEAFVSLTDTVADDVDPLTLLRRLVEHCVHLTSMDAAGVMLANARGRLQSAVVTDERVELTEVFQAQVAEGPCIDSYNTGEPVHAADLADEDRWPVFTPPGPGGRLRRRPQLSPAAAQPDHRRPQPPRPNPHPALAAGRTPPPGTRQHHHDLRADVEP